MNTRRVYCDRIHTLHIYFTRAHYQTAVISSQRFWSHFWHRCHTHEIAGQMVFLTKTTFYCVSGFIITYSVTVF